MRFNDYIDLVQLSEGEYNDTYGYDKKVPIVIAKNLPANFTSMTDDVKLLQNRDIEWHERYIVQHKALMLLSLDILIKSITWSTGDTLLERLR